MGKSSEEETKNKGGRPPKFQTVEELELIIQEYKDYLTKETKPPTIAGLAFYTGIDRKTLYNYKNKDAFFHTIKNFVDWVLMNYEERSITDSTSGLIFLLKNYGYTDRQELEHSGGLNVNDISNTPTDELIKRAEAVKLINQNKND